MAQNIREVMTKDPITLKTSASIAEAARAMRDSDVGNIIVLEGDSIAGILTDRDVTVRAVAEGVDVQSATVGEIATKQVSTLSPDDTVEKAIDLMRTEAIRRVPIVENGTPVGIVAIGDLAVSRDQDSALADISVAAPNN
ncbi:MAG: CBS domain-containing protein [Actinomycetota bacterium]|nr:CBS domain-containing protein [Actinomycetota bacterium]